MAGPRRPDNVVIRERQPADDAAIAALNDTAFGGTYESRLVEDLRAAGLAMVELVAGEGTSEGTTIVGHILFSALSATLSGKPVPALALAPMSVRPDRQRGGIGSALVRTGLGLARRNGWQAVIVLGHPAYYPRFGFSAELGHRLKAPFSGAAFMALELTPRALTGDDGLVVYPPAFRLGDPKPPRG
jgi:putative acetyltransferase